MGQLNPVTIDFETYYTTVDNGAYTLSRMTTEEYVRDPRFEIIGVSVKHGDAPSQFYTGDLGYIQQVLRQIDWASAMAIGHNKSEFDSFIMTQVIGVRPRAYACTLQMARALHGSKDMGDVRGIYAHGYEVEVMPPWDNFPGDSVEADTEFMNRFIENQVLRMPEQYYWVHRRFKTRPPGEQKVYP